MDFIKIIIIIRHSVNKTSHPRKVDSYNVQISLLGHAHERLKIASMSLKNQIIKI